MLIELIIIVLILLFILYKRLTSNFQYYERLGIPYIKPTIILGSFTGLFFGREPFREEFLRRYEELKDFKFYGAFEGSKPVLFINDLELLKKITIKDFDYFRNRRTFIDAKDDPLFGNSVFALADEKWRDMRVTLSPAFTGNKIRLMFKLILNICEKAIKHLDRNIKNKSNSEDGIDIEMKDFFTLFTNDVIASTAFGLEINSLENQSNEFYRMSREYTTFTFWKVVKMIIYMRCKKVFQILRLGASGEKLNKYFLRVFADAMKYRKEHSIVRQDMINILMEANANPEKSHNREWTDEELVAQCSIFLFAGLETVSTTLCFATQELIENLEVQEKLRKEIDSVNEQLNGEPITYEIIHKMKYLEMFMSEVLRIWSPTIEVDRECTKPYKIDEDGLKVDLKVGDVVVLPIIGFHLNENHFLNPLKFDPERFSDENKMNIKPMSYAPFGYGPRSCIASRLALLECKAILFHILTNFKLEVSKKTKIPVEFSLSFLITAKDGFWLKIIPRK